MMLDLDTVDGTIRRRTEVCVVGAGVAGIALTRRLLAAGHEVLLLESGGTDFEAATADLNVGTSSGEDYYPLDHARMRFFGGTTAIRSEEHTSELQSLMRISYAVFCLKKQQQHNTHKRNTNHIALL